MEPTPGPDENAILTTGDVARICRVTKRTVIKWIDAGRLEGFRLPGSTHRRVKGAALARFMRESGLAPSAAPRRERRRILIVDDDPDFVQMLRDALRGRYDVAVARTALEAASTVVAFGPDLVLLDVRLPDLNGLDVCRHLQELRKHRPAAILVMSAYGSEMDLGDVRRRGADGFLPKPVRIPELRNRIRKLVG